MKDCLDPFRRWPIHMTNDDGGAPQDILLLFCLRIDGEVVTGTVSDDDGNPLSTDERVTGRRIRIEESGREVMDLSFRWDKQTEAIQVFMGGSVYEDSSQVTHFEGRFGAFTLGIPLTKVEAGREPLPPPPPDGPDGGDTGTGTGTQT